LVGRSVIRSVGRPFGRVRFSPFVRTKTNANSVFEIFRHERRRPDRRSRGVESRLFPFARAPLRAFATSIARAGRRVRSTRDARTVVIRRRRALASAWTNASDDDDGGETNDDGEDDGDGRARGERSAINRARGRRATSDDGRKEFENERREECLKNYWRIS